MRFDKWPQFGLPQGNSHIIDIILKMGGKIKIEKEKGEVTVTVTCYFGRRGVESC